MDELFGLPEDSDADDEARASDEGMPEVPEPDEEAKTFEPDMATVAFLDQEAAAFAEVADEFEELYGFRHECRCDQDYTEGKVGEVTQCFASMVVDALATCAQLNYENKQLRALADELVAVQEKLAKELDPEHGIEFLDNPATGDSTT